MTHPTSGPISSMLRLFRDGVASYQPAIDGFDLETGDPQVSLDNVQRLIDSRTGNLRFPGSVTRDARDLCLRRAILRPGLRVGTPGLATDALAHFAAKAGFGPEEELREIYHDLPNDTYKGQLVNLNDRPLIYPVP